MTKPIMIKTLSLGDGQPKICVPLTGGTAEELFQEAEKIKEAGADLAEWRADFYEDLSDTDRLVKTMGGIAGILSGIPLLFTVRTEKEGGKAGISPEEITVCAVVGNTAMHHLLLGIHPASLVTPPYMPTVYEAMELDANQWLPASGKIRMLPNIAGFVGGDTVGCMVSTRFDQQQDLTLLIDIGTNGEMVLGNTQRRITCSTAAGPAFEGAKISCGMRGAPGAVDHVTLENGEIHYHVIGDAEPIGLCGSGLLDLVAVLLETGDIDESGRLEGKTYHLCPNVDLTQKDVREVQLAKAAIRTGIELLAKTFGASIDQIQKVYLAGAFGNYLTPASACRIGMIPPVLVDRIVPIGNAAGEGSKLCALSRKEYAYSQKLAKETEFLELASLPQFQDQFVDALEFSEDEES